MSPSNPSFLLKVRVNPRARKNEILGWSGDCLRVKIAAPPVDGKANRALVKFLATSFGLKRSSVTLVRGEKDREKTLCLDGVSRADLAGLPD